MTNNVSGAADNTKMKNYPIFIDFEASFLWDPKDRKTDPLSYPIEFGWTTDKGETRSYLIAPSLEWTFWDNDAEKIHGITREHLEEHGLPADLIVIQFIADCNNKILLTDSPDYEEFWLKKLFSISSIPMPTFRFEHSILFLKDIMLGNHANKSHSQAEAECRALLKEVKRKHGCSHRAGADVKIMLETWLDIKRSL